MLDGEQVLTRFNRLMRELEQGSVNRTCFHPWEVELLVDMDGCSLPSRRRWETLRRYQRAFRRRIEQGTDTPLKLSEYLRSRR
jgi:hypothetical protein